MNNTSYTIQNYVPACIPPYLSYIYLSFFGPNSTYCDNYYPPYIPCL